MLDKIITILNLKQGKAFRISPKEGKGYYFEGEEGKGPNFLKGNDITYVLSLLNYIKSAVK